MAKEKIYVMSTEEISAVEDGLQQFENGQWITNEESNRNVEEWIKSKMAQMETSHERCS